MGVCCIVFDIDGMLFEFLMNFLNIEKKKKFRIFFFQYFMFSSRFMLFPTLKKKKKLVYKKNSGGRGCGFFFRKTILSHFTFYAIFNIKNKYIKKYPFTYWLNGRWFLQIVADIHYILYSLVLILYLKCGGGGGCNVFLTFYAISNISRKNIWEYKPIISHLMFSSCFFCMLEILKSAPSLTATG